MSDTVITFQGLTVVQVSQNQAAVISDPQNHIFVLRNAGFVAYGVTGTYDVLAIVDQTHLPNKIKDHITGVILGRSLEVRMSANVGPVESATKDFVGALLYVPLLVLLFVFFFNDARGTGLVQFGHSGEQLRDFAVRE